MDKLLFHKILNVVSGVTICILCIFLCLRSCTSPDVTQTPLVHTDTITIVKHDTVKYTKVVKQDKWHYDTIHYRDTVYIKDEPKQYVDSTDDYTLRVNAVKLYDYSLDLYKVDTVWQIKEVLVEQPKQKWKLKDHIDWYVGFGVQYGIINKQFDIGPSVGVAITF